MPAAAGTAASAETPGTTSNGDAGLDERERLLAAAAEDERVAALEAHDARAPRRPSRTSSSFIPVLVQRLAGDPSASAGASSTSSGATSRSKHEHVAAPHELEPADGDQPRIAGPGADEATLTPSASSTSSRK